MSSTDPDRSFRRPPSALLDRERRLEPFDWYAEMRAENPVRYDEERRTWDLFRYDAVNRVLTDHETFTSDIERANVDLPDEDRPIGRTMIGADPPEHQRLRGFVNERFQPGTMREYRPRIEAIAAEFVDELDGSDRIDFVSEFAFPFPVTVIAELLGIPAERRDQFKSWSDALVARPTEGTDSAIEETQKQRGRARDEMREYFAELVEERADGDGDDLITLAATTDALSPDEKVSFCILLLVAGNVTTTNLLTNAIRCFDDEGVADAIRSGEIDRTRAIEEVLRYRSPVQALRRVATEDVEIDGHLIEAGQLVSPWVGSANRDPELFDAPDEFRPERSPNPHIAFGKGIHYCLGAPLARIEADVALGALLDRFEVVEPLDVEQTPLATFHGVKSLPCRLESSK